MDSGGGNITSLRISSTHTSVATILSLRTEGLRQFHCGSLCIDESQTNNLVLSGVKAEHVHTPLISRDKILLLNHVYSLCGTMRPSLIRLHGMCLIIIIIIIKDIYIAPFCHAPKTLCKKKVKC